LVEKQQGGQFLGVDPVVLSFAFENQARLPRVGDLNLSGDLAEIFVPVAITGRGLEANGKGLFDRAQLGQNLGRPAAHGAG
jgi:hypothetical protein